MANYLARVELHAASFDDYELLHAQMQQRGFYRAVIGDDGYTHQLPTGTYVVRNTDASIETALAAAKAAADATGRTSSIIVGDWSMLRWQGLSII